MRHPRLFSTMIVATSFVIFGALAPYSAQAAPKKEAPGKKEAPAKKDAAVKPGPYKPVAITLPASTSDASFEAFRKQLAGIAQKKDRAALAGLVAASFFWFPDDTDTADKAKSGIDNLATTIGLAGRNPVGWEVIADFAAETSNMPDPKRQGVICAPVQPTFDDKEAEELAKATQTNPSEWVFPVRDGVEVRSGAQPKAAVIEKLGLHLVRTLEDSSPAAATSVKVITPSGKTGYVPPDAIRDIGGAQMCYVKEGSGWKIAGFLGRV